MMVGGKVFEKKYLILTTKFILSIITHTKKGYLFDESRPLSGAEDVCHILFSFFVALVFEFDTYI